MGKVVFEHYCLHIVCKKIKYNRITARKLWCASLPLFAVGLVKVKICDFYGYRTVLNRSVEAASDETGVRSFSAHRCRHFCERYFAREDGFGAARSAISDFCYTVPVTVRIATPGVVVTAPVAGS